MTQTLLLRRADLEQVGGLDPEVLGGEFIEWLARAESGGLRFGNDPRVLARRRIHGDYESLNPEYSRRLATTSSG